MGAAQSIPPPAGSPPGTPPTVVQPTMTFSCPSEFVTAPGSGMTCMIQCPAQKNYKLTSTGSMLTCSYISDPTISFPLNTVPAYLGDPASYITRPNKDVYKAEIDRFNRELALTDANIDKATKITTAFTALQKAENARDVSPDAYEQARVGYYTLVKGDTWLDEEKNRIANVEAQPVVDKMVSQYNGLKEKRSQQQSTIEVMNGVKDKVLGVKDDLKFSVKHFEKQIGDIKNQINKDKRAQTEAIAETSSWIDVFLNWLIAIVTIIAIFFIARRLGGPGPTLEQIETQARMMRAQAGLIRATKDLPKPTPKTSWWASWWDAFTKPKPTNPTT